MVHVHRHEGSMGNETWKFGVKLVDKGQWSNYQSEKITKLAFHQKLWGSANAKEMSAL